ncbi:MAG: hypothetical protein OXK80_01650 [Bdellovibrionales bacterium]|nr:hypothetical protein [Bdellovibrionales bacterium]
MFRKFIFCFILFVCVGVQAKDDLNVEIGLEFPAYFGMHTKISPHPNIYSRVGLGFVSNLMVGVPGVSTFMGYLAKDYEAEHIEFAFDVIDNSLYGSISVGYRMKQKEGPYAEIGYSVIHKLGGSELPLEDVSTALKQSELIAGEAENPMSRINTTLHNGTLHVGYMFPLSSNVSLSTELGVIKPLYADVDVQHGESGNAEQAKESAKKTKDIMNQLWMVTGSLWLAFSF